MSVPSELNPLTNAHFDQVNSALRSIHNARQLIGAASAAGIDTAAHTALADHLEAKLSALKAAFFPTGKRSP